MAIESMEGAHEHLVVVAQREKPHSAEAPANTRRCAADLIRPPIDDIIIVSVLSHALRPRLSLHCKEVEQFERERRRARARESKLTVRQRSQEVSRSSLSINKLVGCVPWLSRWPVDLPLQTDFL